MSKTSQVDICVEAICAQGCGAVWGQIERLEAGKVLPEAGQLNADEIQLVIKELKSVMAVYKGSCPIV